MRNLLKYTLYMVLKRKIYGFCNGILAMISSSRIATTISRRHTALWERLVPFYEWTQNVVRHSLDDIGGHTGVKPSYNCLQSVHEDWYCTNSREYFVRWWFSSVLPPKNIMSVMYNSVTLSNHGYQFYLPYRLRISIYLHVMMPTKQRTVTVRCRKINMRCYKVVSNRSLRKSTE
jgi:hypothetical protein